MANHTPAIALESALERIKQLEDENEQLALDLDECKNQLSDILQRPNEVSEQKVKDDFDRVFGAIDSWISDVSADDGFNFKAKYANNIHSTRLKNSFRDLGLKGGCFDISWAKKLGELEACHYVVLSLAITRFVVEKIFGDVDLRPKGDLFPPGITKKQKDFIEQVKTVMGSDSDTPKGDTSQYSKWRGETISALTSTQKYKGACDSKITHLNKSLRADLEKWIDSKRLDEHFGSLRSKVLNPVYELLHVIGRSRKTYQLSLEKATPRSIPVRDSSRFFQEMAKWMKVPSSEVTGSIRYLYPGLIRKGYGCHEDLILVQPVALGYRDSDLQPRSSASRSTSTSISPRRTNNRFQMTSSDSVREPRRSKKDEYEASRSSNKPSRADNAQKKPFRQGLREKPRIEREGMMQRASQAIFPHYSSSRPSHPTPPRNEGRRQVEPGVSRSGTSHPESHDTDMQGLRRGSGGQNASDSHPQDLFPHLETSRYTLTNPNTGETIPVTRGSEHRLEPDFQPSHSW
ncbi:hypothetical protein F4860DRAFT_200032 [Xylaria cubensis]|nr:hypothetical protein F4860DRAFT_200032 [Xylaria cubensis]